MLTFEPSQLGSASTSSNIPAAVEVTRKGHSVTEGGVRGAQNVGNTESMTNQLKDPAAQQDGTANGSANNSTGFSNQVDKAFNVANGTSKTSGTTNGTTLGASNAVLTGSS